ncbi:MAG: DNA topoisomerase, partial [Myxococcota bacterium]
MLTYPRTDSNYLTSDMKQGLPRALQGVEVGPWAPFCRHLLDNLPLKVTRRIVNDKEVGDHHAIIPTGRRPDMSRLSDVEKRVLDLVVRRFIAVFYPDAVFATTRIETVVVKHRFLTTGRVRLEAGWQEVEPPPARRGGTSAKPGSGAQQKGGASKPKGASKKGAKRGEVQELPDVRQGESVPVVKCRVHQGMTQPPKRYSESALLGAMERAGRALDDEELRRAMKESGLGTPATRASTIETLLRRDYITRRGKQLVPTVQGRALINALPVDVFKSAQLTGEWEHKLSQVEGGRIEGNAFMDEVRTMVQAVVPSILGAEPVPQPGIEERALGQCPVCGTLVLEQYKAYTCQRGRACSFVIWKKIAGRTIRPKLVQVLLSKRITKRLKGFKSKAGKKFETRLALTDEGKVEFRFDDAPSQDNSSNPSGGTRHSQTSSARAQSRPSSPRSQSRPSSSSSPSDSIHTNAAAQQTAVGASPSSRRSGGPPAPKRSSRGSSSPSIPGGAASSAEVPADRAEASTARADVSTARAGVASAGAEASTAGAPLGSEPVVCPSCGEGHMIRGHRGWGCTAWRQGCRFVIWFQLRGRTLPEDEVVRPLRRRRSTS